MTLVIGRLVVLLVANVGAEGQSTRRSSQQRRATNHGTWLTAGDTIIAAMTQSATANTAFVAPQARDVSSQTPAIKVE